MLSRQSLNTLPVLLQRVSLPLFLLLLVDALPVISTRLESYEWLFVLIGTFLSFYLYIYATLKSGEFWIDLKSLPQRVTGLSFSVFFRVFMLLMTIYCISAALFFPVIAGILLLIYFPLSGSILCVVLSLPALLYFVNRSLAIYVLLFEGVEAKQAMKQSRNLMSIESWYSISGPVARLSLVLLPPALIYLATSFYSLSGNLVEALFIFAGIRRGLPEILVAQLLSQISSVLIINMMTGFYFDMKQRFYLFTPGAVSSRTSNALLHKCISILLGC